MYTPVTPVSNPVILVRIQQKKSGSDKIRKSIILFYFLFCNLLTPLFLNRLAIQKVQFVKFLKIYNKIVFFSLACVTLSLFLLQNYLIWPHKTLLNLWTLNLLDLRSRCTWPHENLLSLWIWTLNQPDLRSRCTWPHENHLIPEPTWSPEKVHLASWNAYPVSEFWTNPISRVGKLGLMKPYPVSELWTNLISRVGALGLMKTALAVKPTLLVTNPENRQNKQRAYTVDSRESLWKFAWIVQYLQL